MWIVRIEERHWNRGFECGTAFHWDGHQLAVGREEKQLLAISPPSRPTTASG
jgi:hypothetical protein